MNNELVSIIMSVYNEEENWLKKAIESILNQTYKNIEFIIILDNPDNTKLEKIILDYLRIDNRIIFFKNKRNMGLVYSLNRGIQQSQGKYIARMDADDISELDRIEIQKNFLENKNLDFVGSNIINFIDDNVEQKSNYPITEEQIYKFLKKANPLAHPTWFLKKSVFNEVGLYRNIFANEDYDFILRCSTKKIKIENIEKPLLKYRISPNSISRSNLFEQLITTYYLSRNIYRINDITEDDIKVYLTKFTKKTKQRFLKAYHYASKSATSKINNNLVKYIFYKILAMTKSYLFFKINYLKKLER